MTAEYATSFSEYVDWIATNCPHAAVLDWWRRLDRALQDYFRENVCRPSGSRAELERFFEARRNFGSSGVDLLRRLRRRRNEVAHEAVGSLSREEAIRFAQEAQRIIGALLYNKPISQLKYLPVD